MHVKNKCSKAVFIITRNNYYIMNIIVASLEHLMLLPKIAINKFINKNRNILMAFRCIVLLTINNTSINIYLLY